MPANTLLMWHGGAGHVHVRAGQRERRVVVVERGAGPVRGRVARVAGRREARRRVSWVGGPVVVRHVAAGAESIGRCEVVIVVGVARCARQGGVRAGQREAGRVVVERGARPVRRSVADRAVGREVGRLVSCGLCRAVVIGLVARVAGGRQVIEVVVGVALRAVQRGVRAGQRRKFAVQRVVEGRRASSARCRVVAGSAVGREAGRRVAGLLVPLKSVWWQPMQVVFGTVV